MLSSYCKRHIITFYGQSLLRASAFLFLDIHWNDNNPRQDTNRRATDDLPIHIKINKQFNDFIE